MAPRRPRSLPRARVAHLALPVPVGADDAGRAGERRLALAGHASRAPAAPRDAPDCRSRASRQRPAVHQSGRRGVCRWPGRLCAGLCATLPLGRRVHARQRAEHDGPIQRAVWPLVSACAVGRGLLPGPPGAMPRHRRGDAGRPLGEPARAVGADRRRGADPIDATAAQAGGLRDGTALARLGSRRWPGRRAACAVALAAQTWRLGAAPGVVSAQRLSARHRRSQLLRHQRSLSRSCTDQVPGVDTWRQWSAAVCRRRSGARARDDAVGTCGGNRGGLGPVRAAGRTHRGASRLHA